MKKYIIKLNWPSKNTAFYYFSTIKQAMQFLRSKKKDFPFAIFGSECPDESFVIFKNGMGIKTGTIGYKSLIVYDCDPNTLEVGNDPYYQSISSL